MSMETDDEGLIRLQKLLAMSNVASRRKCEELMLAASAAGHAGLGEQLLQPDQPVVVGPRVRPAHAVSEESRSPISGRYGASSGRSSRDCTPMRSRK